MQSAVTRDVYCADSTEWMRSRGVIPGASAVTSLPDVSEVGLELNAWRHWFSRCVVQVIDAIEPSAAAVFFQSDIKRNGTWIDKGALVTRVAEDAGANVLFHKIVCRCPPGTITYGRPGYTHLIAVSRAFSCPEVLPIPDIIVDAGRQPWVRAMGIRAAAHAVRFVRDFVKSQTIFDPFCGVGTVLAVANTLGLHALGVEKSRKRAEQSRSLAVGINEV
jgi:hypothetical protein